MQEEYRLLKELREFISRYKHWGLIPLLILLILLSVIIIFGSGGVHTPFIYSRF